MTSKTMKTVLFASLIAAMILPFSAMGIADAAPNENANDKAKDQIRKDKNKVAHEKLTKDITDKKFRDNIPLVLSYIDEDGKVVALVDKEGKETKKTYEKRIKDLVGEDAEVQVNSGWFERDSCSSRYSNCDPLYGGIRVYVSGEGYSTLTIGATDNSGVEGFVTSSHAVGSGVNQDVRQPGSSSSGKVGDVETNPSLNNRKSDAAFVDLSSSEDTSNKIYRTSSQQYTVTGTANPVYQTHVQKTGYTSGESSGYVLGTGLTVYADGITSKDQVAANYYSLSGDSGAPVYSYSASAGNVSLYGIHVGKACLTNSNPCPSGYLITVFSKWSNVDSELGINTIP